jgi:hypothetical protein
MALGPSPFDGAQILSIGSEWWMKTRTKALMKRLL